MGNYKLEFLHLADAATRDSLGKISILGIFHKLGLNRFPGKFLKFTLVCEIGYSGVSEESAVVEVEIVSEGNKKVKIKPPISTTFNFSEKQRKVGGKLGFILDVGNLTFEKEGKYAAVVKVDGKEVGRKKFTVERAPTVKQNV